MIKKLLVYLSIVSFFLPVFASAQVGGGVFSPTFWKRIGGFLLPATVSDTVGSSTVNAVFNNLTVASGTFGSITISSLVVSPLVVGGTSSSTIFGNGATSTFGGSVSASGSLISSALTNGSVLFSTSSGIISQNNANFYWDNANSRLGIATSTPISVLHVDGALPRITMSDSTNGKSYQIRSVSSTLDIFDLSSSTVRLSVNNSGMIGIATTTPASTLHIIGDLTLTSSILMSNNQTLNWGGSSEKITGSQSLNTLSISTNNVNRIQVASGGFIGISTTTPSGLLHVATGTIPYALFVSMANGRVGVATNTPATALSVNGVITQTSQLSCATGLTTDATGAINGCVASDEKLKTDVSSYPFKSIVDKLRPVFYRWIDTKTKDDRVHAGFIAQEVQKVIPEAVVSSGGDYIGVDPLAINATLVLELQELRKRVANLEKACQ